MVQHPSPDGASDPASAGPTPGEHAGGRSARAADAADRLSRLTHELAGLLDGSLRWIGLAERGLPEAEGPIAEEVERTRRQLDTVREALLRMARLVSEATDRGADAGTFAHPLGVTLGEAVDHAADVLRPRATELGIAIAIEIQPDAGRRRAGAMYSVVLNGLRNAVDSIARANGGRAGEGRITARLRTGEHDDVVLEIEDDGTGPPEGVEPGAVFRPDFSSRPGGGIGLALAKEIVDQAGGRIELIRRARGARGGAVLRVTWRPDGGGDAADG